uniref:Uncharacterized protein n=1 Tax=Anguilla anguilla TaxID=7936 RepID=A0A0E9SEJ2_ANGAN
MFYTIKSDCNLMKNRERNLSLFPKNGRKVQ